MSQPWRKLSDEAASEQLHDLIREADLDTLTALYENAFGAVEACEVDLENTCLRVLFRDGFDDETLEPIESDGAPVPAIPIKPTLHYTLEEYRNAPSGIGPLAAQWKDKPHRLVYDLCKVLKQAGF